MKQKQINDETKCELKSNSQTIIVGTGVISDASWKYEVIQQSAEMGGGDYSKVWGRQKRRILQQLKQEILELT